MRAACLGLALLLVPAAAFAADGGGPPASKSKSKSAAKGGAAQTSSNEEKPSSADAGSEQSASVSEPGSAEAAPSPAEPATVAAESDSQPASAETPPAPGSLDRPSRFTLSLQVPVARYVRRRLTEEGASTYRSTMVEGPFTSFPTLRAFYRLDSWIHLGAELSGGLRTQNIDESGETESTVTAGLDVALRVTPWSLPWGAPQLTVAVGGRFFDGYFIDDSRSSTDVTAFSPSFSGDLGVFFWVVKDVAAVEIGLGAGYVFGPATIQTAVPADAFLQQLDLSVDSGLLVRF